MKLVDTKPVDPDGILTYRPAGKEAEGQTE